MGWIAVRKCVDEQFGKELAALDRDYDWKLWALSGRMYGEAFEQFCDDGREPRRAAKGNIAEERRAWRWGYYWKPGAAKPMELPEGACRECWRLGEACNEHYQGLCPAEVERLAQETLETIVVDGELRIWWDGAHRGVDEIPFEQLQRRVT